MKHRSTSLLSLVAILLVGLSSCFLQRKLEEAWPVSDIGDNINAIVVDSALSIIDAPALPDAPPPDTFTYRLQFQMSNWGPRNFDQVAANIDSSLASANRYFQGYIKWERDPTIYTYDLDLANIYTLYDDFAERKDVYNRWVNQRAATPEEGVITIFLLPTFPKGNSVLLGFCPVLMSHFDFYQRYYYDATASDAEAPDTESNFEHLFISYQGATGRNTLAHELGHWLGLAHVWELDLSTRRQQGLVLAATRDVNLMNYVEHPQELTRGQLETAWQFAGAYRSYLLQ